MTLTPCRYLLFDYLHFFMDVSSGYCLKLFVGEFLLSKLLLLLLDLFFCQCSHNLTIYNKYKVTKKELDMDRFAVNGGGGFHDRLTHRGVREHGGGELLRRDAEVAGGDDAADHL